MPNKKNKKLVLLGSLSPSVIKTLKYAGLGIVTVGLMIAVYFGEQTGDWFKASVLDAPQPFNGTVMPVSKVPKWQYWNEQKTLKYDQIPETDLIDLPPYDLNKMQFPNEQLKWNDASQNDIRNAKITYSVVYLGNYKYDHKENVGSHLAIDLKMPVGTPLHSIANGKVVKTSMQSSGFGHHVVIKHTGVPDPDDPTRTTTLYSAYNHMDAVSVNEGQNVLKGQIVGTSGNTGTSTTPHLHFQIDRESAPWHPWWPFSWSESQEAGLSFFEAVNAGLGLSGGRANTVNPMEFVINNLGSNFVASSVNNSSIPDNTNSDPEPTPQPDPTPAPDPTPIPEPEPDPTANFTDDNKAQLFSYDITGENVSLINNGVTLYAEDKDGQYKTLNEDDPIDIELEGVGQLIKKRFHKSDFNNNILKIVVKSSEVGDAIVKVGKSSYRVTFIDEVKGIQEFIIEHDGNYQKNIVETVKIIAIDEDGNVSPAVSFTGVVNIKTTDGIARIVPDQIEARDFKNGVAEIKVTVSNESPVRLRAQNGALVGVSDPLRIEDKLIFADINYRHPNYDAIKYLKEQNIISGYSDGTFKPNNVVNRAEALKMLMTAFNVNVGGNYEINFTDVDSNAWFAGSIAAAAAKGIVKGYDDGSFKPDSLVNRAEYIKILLGSADVEPSGDMTQPYSDVNENDWFAAYAYLANKMNLLAPAENFRPADPMTRAGVAETIYRLKMVQEGNLVVYAK